MAEQNNQILLETKDLQKHFPIKDFFGRKKIVRGSSCVLWLMVKMKYVICRACGLNARLMLIQSKGCSRIILVMMVRVFIIFFSPEKALLIEHLVMKQGHVQ